MSPEAQRIAIAMSLGWDEESARRGFETTIREQDGYTYSQISTKLPDYLNDLNAMHEACKTLTEQQELVFRGHLHTITRRDYKSGVRSQILSTINATAVQRCEAFLKTIGKWITT